MSKEPSPINQTNDILSVADALHSSFKASASFSYFLKKIFNIELDENFSDHRNKAIMYYYSSMYSDLGGEVIECDDFNAVALVSPPGVHIDFSETKDTRFNKVWYEDYDSHLESFIGENPFYYINLVGRNFNKEKKKGTVTKIFKHYMKMSDLKGCPIVLEAISEEAKNIYEHYGFKTVHSFSYGQNEVDENGQLDPKGKGFVAYLMIYYSGNLNDYKKKIVEVNDLPKINPKTYEFIDVKMIRSCLDEWSTTTQLEPMASRVQLSVNKEK